MIRRPRPQHLLVGIYVVNQSRTGLTQRYYSRKLVSDNAGGDLDDCALACIDIASRTRLVATGSQWSRQAFTRSIQHKYCIWIWVHKSIPLGFDRYLNEVLMIRATMINKLLGLHACKADVESCIDARRTDARKRKVAHEAVNICKFLLLAGSCDCLRNIAIDGTVYSG